uniref:Mesoderm development candidate 2 n=1 Tax=Megaselia scalaris TaxID=36166 RepID=T1GFP3_MEGSC
MERLLDQWNEGEEDEYDDLENPMNIKQPQININELQDKSPEDLLKLTKKGKTLMTFVKVSGNPTKEEAEELTKLWQTALWNNHLQAERYMVDDDRAIFMFKDGSQALDAKEYLVEQERCESVTIENKVFEGKHQQPKDEL